MTLLTNKQIDQIKTYKLIAKWFLAAQLTIVLAWTYLGFIYRHGHWLATLPMMLLLMLIFGAMNMTVVTKNQAKFSIKNARIKLSAVAIMTVIPGLILLLWAGIKHLFIL